MSRICHVLQSLAFHMGELAFPNNDLVGGFFLSKCCQFAADLESINHFEDAQDRQKVPNCQEFHKIASVALMKDFFDQSVIIGFLI